MPYLLVCFMVPGIVSLELHLLQIRDKWTGQISKLCFSLLRRPTVEEHRLCIMATLGWNPKSTTFN